MMKIPLGIPVHGDFSSADASALTETAARILLYGPDSTVAITLAATDWVIVSDLTIAVGATALTVTIYDGVNNAAAAGEIIARTIQGAASTVTISLNVPHYCKLGTWPKVFTSAAGQVDVALHGTIDRKG
jgi:hypothetical protein